MKRASKNGARFSSLLLKKSWDLPGEKQVKKPLENLSLTEKWIFGGIVFLLIFSSLTLLLKANNRLMVEVPAEGGTLIEGIVGSPRFINPLLTLSNADADKDLTSLVYSGLLKSTPDGSLIPDLAESYQISEDGLTYIFTLKENIRFHDNTQITTEDVLFTITQAQNPSLRSPRRSNWEGVNVEIHSEKEISFILTQPYSPFIENMTMGILPKHLWSELSSDEFAFSFLNTKPIGSGPYKIDSVKKDSSNLPTQYTLSAFKNYASGKPFIKKIIFKFYPNEDALLDAYKKGQVESIYAISPNSAKILKEKGVKIETTILPRIFGLFFNQNQASIFSEKAVREALNISLDKQKIVEKVLNDYGLAINSPVPASFSKLKDFLQKDIDSENSEKFDGIEKAKSILDKNGWVLKNGETIRSKKTKSGTTHLEFSISTSNVEDLKLTANILKEEWAKIGAEVEILVFDANGDLSQNVIRPRKYETLLFGISIGKDLDLFPFWHSSQRNDPGFNVALYVNKKTDSLLEEGRAIQNKAERLEKYQEFEQEIQKDIPAVFIYSPDFIYAVPKNIKNLELGFVTSPSERLLNIENWYIETTRVWKLFDK